MKPDKFIDAMGHIDEKYIEEYQAAKKQKRTPAFIKFATLAASVAVVLSASLLIWYHSRTNDPVVPPQGGSVATDAPVTGNNQPNDPPHITHEDFKIVSVSAEKAAGNFISGDTSFVVKTEHGTAEDVRTHLYISSAPEYEVVQIAEETFEVYLSGNIADNTVVSLSYVQDGIVDQSWAFQTEGKLSLAGSYPADGTTTASVNTVIELEFSYSSAEGVEDAVTFEPELEGTWEHAGRIWRFTPSQPLEKNSTYKIYVGNGITADGKELEKTATVTFSTYEEHAPYSCSADIITVDGINSYLPGSDITIRYVDKTEGGTLIGHVAIENFATHSDMIAFTEGETVYNAEYYSDAEFTVEALPGNAVNLTITDSLSCGYYVARVYAEDSTHLFDWVIQVHTLSVYASVTERDILLWIAEDGTLAEGIPVRFLDFEGVTEEDGTLLMEDVTDGSGEVRYLFAGDEEMPFVMGTPSFTHENYPKSYIYTDRPKYKSTDTVKVWGMIPLGLFYDEPDGKFEVILADETDTAVTVKPDENGTFECEIELQNHKDTDCNIHIKYEGTAIGSRRIQIENYSLKNYTFETIVEKDFAYMGEELEFSVKLTHVSGIAVSGKELCASLGNINSQEIFATTDKDGIAHFVITPEIYDAVTADFSKYFGAINTLNASIRNANIGDSYNNSTGVSLYIIRSDTMAERSFTDNVLTSHFFNIDTTGIMLLGDGDFSVSENDLTKLSICGSPVNGTAEYTINLYKETRYVEKQGYDPLSKTNYPVYSDDTTLEVIETKTESVKFTDGIATLDLTDHTLPEATETERYYISVRTDYIPEDGIGTHYNTNNNKIISNSFVSSQTVSTNRKNIGHSTYGPENKFVYDMPESYHMYTYAIERCGEYVPSAEGDTISYTLRKYDDTAAEGGKILYFMYGQGVRKLAVTDDQGFDITVDDDAIPNAKIGAAFFKDGVFHRVVSTSVGLHSDNRKIEPEIITDKEEYSPGDTVTVTVSLSSGDKILPNTAVNVCVVNEAVYTYWDGINILSTIFTGASTRDYFYSSYRDYDLVWSGWGWGGGGGHEAEFSDTVYFGSSVTDEDGKCTVTFDLPKDRVTSYRITVHAANRDLYAGSATANITASSDFFIQPGEIKNAKAVDDLTLSATLITAEPDTAQITFRLNELDLEQTVPAESGKAVFVNFGKVPAGDYTATLTAICDSGDEDKTHSITFPVKVAVSTLKITEEHTVNVTDSTELVPASSPVTLKIMTEEAERYFKYIAHSESVLSDRLDTVIGKKMISIIEDKLTGDNDSEPNITVSDYAKSQEDSRGRLLALLPDGEGNPVLTALYAYLTGETYYTTKLESASTEAEIAKSLLIRAAVGDPVLADLLYAKDKVSDDPYTRMILSLALSISGDTHTAAEILVPLGDNITEGDRALYAMALVFTDRASAATKLDSLIDSDPTETYLTLATAVYMKTGEKQIGNECSLTVVCGEQRIPVTVNGLEVKELVLTTEEDTVSFENADDNIRIKYSYESTFTPKEDDHNISGLAVTAPENIGLYECTSLKITLPETLADRAEYSGTVKVALPNCFRQDTDGSTGESNIAVIRFTEEDSEIAVPLIAVSTGSYVIEPIILTVDGINYYSSAIEVTVTGENRGIPSFTVTDTADTAIQTETTAITS